MKYWCQIEHAFRHTWNNRREKKKKKGRERIWRKEKTRKLEIRTRKKYFATGEARVAVSSDLPQVLKGGHVFSSRFSAECIFGSAGFSAQWTLTSASAVHHYVCGKEMDI